MLRRRWSDGLPTPRAARRIGNVRVLVVCNSCRHQADADLGKLVESGCGDASLIELRFRCSRCGADRTDFVVTSRDNPQPW
jgi:transposase-like protein